MNDIKIKLLNSYGLSFIIKADGEKVSLISNGSNSFIANHKTEFAKVKLEISTYNELSQKGCLFRAFILWVIGIFGIFCPKYQKNNMLLNYSAELEVGQATEIILSVATPVADKEAIQLKLNGAMIDSNESNKWIVDAVANKNLKVYKSVSKLGRLLGLIGIVIIVILTII